MGIQKYKKVQSSSSPPPPIRRFCMRTRCVTKPLQYVRSQYGCDIEKNFGKINSPSRSSSVAAIQFHTHTTLFLFTLSSKKNLFFIINHTKKSFVVSHSHLVHCT